MANSEMYSEEDLVGYSLFILQSMLIFRNAQEEASINITIQRLVNRQDALLDAMESRRFSISSTSSTLTELSSSDEPEQDLEAGGIPPAHALLDVTNITHDLPKKAVAMGTNPAPRFELCSKTTDATGHVLKNAPASPKKPKKARRRLKKKTSISVAETKSGLEHRHQLDRMKNYKDEKGQEKSRRTRMQSKLLKQALDRAITVPFELEEFRASRSINLESRVYCHEELAALGIRTICWDGQ